jgi:hypothetical protein
MLYGLLARRPAGQNFSLAFQTSYACADPSQAALDRADNFETAEERQAALIEIVLKNEATEQADAYAAAAAAAASSQSDEGGHTILDYLSMIDYHC